MLEPKHRDEILHKFRKYVGGRPVILFIGIGTLAAAAILILVALLAGEEEIAAWSCLTLLICVPFFAYHFLLGRKDKRVAKLLLDRQMAGELDDMLVDFKNGVYMQKNSICLGNRYLFIKHGRNAYKFSEITKVYEYINGDGTKIKSHAICAVSNGMTFKVCRLPRAKAEDEVKALYNAIYQRNGAILLLLSS